MIINNELKTQRLDILSAEINKGASLVFYSSDDEVICIVPFTNDSVLSNENGLLTFKPLEQSIILVSAIVVKAKVLATDQSVIIDGISVDLDGQVADILLPVVELYAGGFIIVSRWSIGE